MTRIDKHVDFLDSNNKIIDQSQKKITHVSKFVLAFSLIFAVFIASFGFNIITSGEQLAQKFGNVGLWGQLRHLVSSEDEPLDGEAEDRINVLLLGMGGENHDGPYLTDTLMVASFKPSTKKVALLSIPRDLLVNIPGYGWRKINHANAFGEDQNPGHGGELASETISAMLDIPIHYYVRIDFEGFKQIIDDLGGVTVDVENEINDYQYPVLGKEDSPAGRYEHLHIEKGPQDMDGSLALKYVRSRHSAGIEGSDFARSARQQKVIMAAKDKALSFGTLANPYRISRIMETMSKHLATNLEIWEILKLYNMGKDITEADVARFVFDNSPEGLLYDGTTEGGAYVLMPRGGNFSQMQRVAEHIFDTATTNNDSSEQQVLSDKTKQETTKKAEPVEPPDVEIHNGTKISGLAAKMKTELQNEGFTVIRTANAPTQDYQKTVVYNIGGDDAEDEAKKVARIVGATVATTIPQWVQDKKSMSTNTEILVILGTDQQYEQ